MKILNGVPGICQEKKIELIRVEWGWIVIAWEVEFELYEMVSENPKGLGYLNMYLQSFEV